VKASRQWRPEFGRALRDLREERVLTASHAVYVGDAAQQDGLVADVEVGVVISDSFGRAWRVGTVGVAIGAAGLSSVLDLRGQPDLFGRQLKVTVVGHADEIAAAASLVMGQGAEACPAVLVRGLAGAGLVGGGDTSAAALLRPPGEDLFR
jgi:coenzyme F420-0:L-glutamate ligase/coenzyme F420-1:gamma-L-glutamate ligase